MARGTRPGIQSVAYQIVPTRVGAVARNSAEVPKCTLQQEDPQLRGPDADGSTAEAVRRPLRTGRSTERRRPPCVSHCDHSAYSPLGAGAARLCRRRAGKNAGRRDVASARPPTTSTSNFRPHDGRRVTVRARYGTLLRGLTARVQRFPPTRPVVTPGRPCRPAFDCMRGSRRSSRVLCSRRPNRQIRSRECPCPLFPRTHASHGRLQGRISATLRSIYTRRSSDHQHAVA